MFTNSQFSQQSKTVWKYALVGGLASLPFTIGLYWLSGAASEFSYNMVFLGGILTGYLANRGQVKARSAGIRAGLIGGFPGIVLGLATFLGVPSGSPIVWSDTLLEALFLLLVGAVLVGVSLLAGLLGGIVGGWLSKQFSGRGMHNIGT